VFPLAKQIFDKQQTTMTLRETNIMFSLQTEKENLPIEPCQTI